VILTIAAFLGIPAAVYDTIGRFHAIESQLPSWAIPYLPVVYLSAFVVGLAVLGTAPDEDPDVSALHESNTRLGNTVARQDDEIRDLKRQVEVVLTVERPRAITSNQSREIATRLRAWSGYSDLPHMRQVLVMASPKGHDAKTYAGQIRMAFEHGHLWSDEVLDFTEGDDAYSGGEYEEVNRGFLKAHDANVTIWGSDATEHSGEPLDQALLDAFRVAGVDAVHHPGPTSLGGRVAVIVGRGVVTQSARQQEEILRLREELAKQLRDAAPRDISQEQRTKIMQRVNADGPVDGNPRRWRVNVVPLTNATDSNQFAKAIVSVLESFSDPQIGGSDSMALKHLFSDEDTTGIVLLAGKSLYTQALEERHKKHEQLIIDAFAAGEIEIKRGECEYLIRETTLLVGRRA